MILLVLGMEAATVEPFAPIDFDLARVKPKADEIVVTARRRDQRLPDLAPAEPAPKAETGLFGALRGGVQVEQKPLPGAISNRVMMKLKLPF